MKTAPEYPSMHISCFINYGNHIIQWHVSLKSNTITYDTSTSYAQLFFELFNFIAYFYRCSPDQKILWRIPPQKVRYCHLYPISVFAHFLLILQLSAAGLTKLIIGNLSLRSIYQLQRLLKNSNFVIASKEKQSLIKFLTKKRKGVNSCS